MARHSLILALALVAAGCLGDGTGTPGSDVPAVPGPVDLVAPTFLDPIDLGPGGRAAEPSLVVGPEGRVYVVAGGQLWRSRDHGATFEALGTPACRDTPLPGGTCPPGRSYVVAGIDGAGGDVDLAVDDQGTLYFVGLNGASGSVPFLLSRDEGATWSEPVDLAAGNSSDRQWIHASASGVLSVNWRDRGDPDTEGAPAYLAFRQSPDGGATWGPIRRVADDAVAGPITRDASSGALYVPYWEQGIRIARSTDEGETWSLHQVTTAGELSLDNDQPTNIFPMAAVDTAGVLYVAWSEDVASTAPGGTKALAFEVKLASSRDGGNTWSGPVTVSTPGRIALLPALLAGAPGRVAIAWYEAEHPSPTEDVPNVWHVRLVESVDAATNAPTFLGGRANRDPVHVGAFCADGGECNDVCIALAACVPTRVCQSFLCAGRDRSRTDLFEMDVRADGHPLLVWVADADAASADPSVRLVVGGVADGTPIR